MNTIMKGMNVLSWNPSTPKSQISAQKKVTNVVSNLEAAANLLIPGLPASINFLGFHVKANNH